MKYLKNSKTIYSINFMDIIHYKVKIENCIIHRATYVVIYTNFKRYEKSIKNLNRIRLSFQILV